MELSNFGQCRLEHRASILLRVHFWCVTGHSDR